MEKNHSQCANSGKTTLCQLKHRLVGSAVHQRTTNVGVVTKRNDQQLNIPNFYNLELYWMLSDYFELLDKHSWIILKGRRKGREWRLLNYPHRAMSTAHRAIIHRNDALWRTLQQTINSLICMSVFWSRFWNLLEKQLPLQKSQSPCSQSLSRHNLCHRQTERRGKENQDGGPVVTCVFIVCWHENSSFF